MSKQYDAMIAGHLCFDVIPKFKNKETHNISEILQPGKLVQVSNATMSTGGPVSNTGINMKTLGNDVCFCARIGDDDFGKLTNDYLSRNGNVDGIHVVEGATSSYTIVIAPPGIDRIFLHNTGTNDDFCAEDLNPDVISQCKLFHFGYPPLMAKMYENEGDELTKILKIAKEAGATVSMDMALPDPNSPAGKTPWSKILKNTLPYVDIFLPSIEEAFYMLEPQKFIKMKKKHNGNELIEFLSVDFYGDIADRLLEMGTKMVSLKSGYRGYYFKTKDKSVLSEIGEAKPGNVDNWSNREVWCPAFNSPSIASASGSGDSAIAGFLTAYLKGLNLESALKYANCYGWQNIQELDALSGIKSWDITTEMLKSDMEMIDINIKDSDWKWSKEFKLWTGPDDKLSKSI